ncbi:MAG: hypothetical protein J6W13_12815 [Salinivirgaceae bacterium]|nr:hypothetical protein [Salinivirgaceae bacterium]
MCGIKKDNALKAQLIIAQRRVSKANCNLGVRYKERQRAESAINYSPTQSEQSERHVGGKDAKRDGALKAQLNNPSTNPALYKQKQGSRSAPLLE